MVYGELEVGDWYERKQGLVKLAEEDVFGLVDLGGQVGRASSIGMVQEHHALVGLDDLNVRGVLFDAQYEGCLPAVHGFIKGAHQVFRPS